MVAVAAAASPLVHEHEVIRDQMRLGGYLSWVDLWTSLLETSLLREPRRQRSPLSGYALVVYGTNLSERLDGNGSC